MKTNTEKEIELNPDFICSITRLYYLEPVKTNCNHVFEKEALEKWIDKKRKDADAAADESEDEDDNSEKNKNSDEISVECPACRQPMKSYPDDLEMKQKTDAFLYSNLPHLYHRYLNAQLGKVLGIEKNKFVPVKLIGDHPHLIFLQDDKNSIFKMIVSTPLDTIKECFQTLQKKIPALDVLFLGVNSAVKSLFLSTILSCGDIEKFEYFFALIKNDISQIIQYTSTLKLAASTKKIEFFNHILKLINNPLEIRRLLETVDHGTNCLMYSCAHSSHKIVEGILNFFTEAPELTIVKLFSNNQYTNIFDLAGFNSNDESYEITKTLETFLAANMLPENLKIFKEYCKTRANVNYMGKYVREITQLQKQVKALQDDLDILKRRPAMQPLQLFAQPHGMLGIPENPSSTQSAATTNNNNEAPQAATNTQQPSINPQSFHFHRLPRSGGDEDHIHSHQVQCAQQ